VLYLTLGFSGRCWEETVKGAVQADRDPRLWRRLNFAELVIREAFVAITTPNLPKLRALQISCEMLSQVDPPSRMTSGSSNGRVERGWLRLCNLIGWKKNRASRCHISLKYRHQPFAVAAIGSNAFGLQKHFVPPGLRELEDSLIRTVVAIAFDVHPNQA